MTTFVAEDFNALALEECKVDDNLYTQRWAFHSLTEARTAHATLSEVEGYFLEEVKEYDDDFFEMTYFNSYFDVGVNAPMEEIVFLKELRDEEAKEE